MATPVLESLQAAFPDAHITWIVEHHESATIDAHPAVDELLLWNSDFWRKRERRKRRAAWLLQGARLLAPLRARRYDTFISFQPEEWPLLARFCGASVRIGVFDTFQQTHHDQPTSPNTRYYTHAFTAPDLPAHRTDQYLLALKPLGVAPVSPQMTMGLTAQDAHAAAQVLPPDDGRRLVVIAPLTTWPSRCWEASRYAALGARLQAAGYAVALIGSPREADAIHAIAAQMPCPPLVVAGTLSFREVAALIARAALLVSGDTGPMHVAAAVGTPYLSLFGATPAPGRRPLAGRGTVLLHLVPCGPCDRVECANPPETFMRCLRLITTDEAADAALHLLGE